MPTKPLVQPEAWATDAVYTTGPFIGQPQKVVPPGAFAAEGHRPGSLFPTPAEYENSQQNRITELSRWLFLGSFAGAADAHVLETNAAGRTAATGLTLIDGVDETVLSVEGVSTSDPTVYVESTFGAAGIQVEIANAAGAVGVTVEVGTGANSIGYDSAMTGSPATARAFRTIADAATAGVLAELTTAGTGLALDVLGTNATAMAARVRGGADAIALDVETAVAGGVTGRALRAVATDSAIAIEATGVNAAAIRASVSGVGPAALDLPGKSTDPLGVVDGRVDRNTTTNTIVVASNVDGFFRDVWTSRGGIVIGYAGPLAFTTTVGGVFTPTSLVVSCTNGNAPKRAARALWIHFVCSDARCLIAPPPSRSLDLQLSEATDGILATRQGIGTGDTAGFVLGIASTEWQRSVCWSYRYTIPAIPAPPFDRIFTISQASTNGAVRVRDAYLIVEGLY